jgi:hypothetical protein
VIARTGEAVLLDKVVAVVHPALDGVLDVVRKVGDALGDLADYGARKVGVSVAELGEDGLELVRGRGTDGVEREER